MGVLVKPINKNFRECRLIGKSVVCTKNGNEAKELWKSCLNNDTFQQLEKLPLIYKQYVGFVSDYDIKNNNYTYIIGMLHKPNTPVPEGYVFKDISKKRMFGGKIKDSKEHNYDLFRNLVEEATKEACYRILDSYGYSLELYEKKKVTVFYQQDKDKITLEYFIPSANKVVDYYDHNDEDKVFSKITVLHNTLLKHKVPKESMDYILEGANKVKRNSKKEVQSKFMKNAIDRMDEVFNNKTKKEIREDCACCLGGKRLALSQAIAREFKTLDERIEAANKTPEVFAYRVKKEEDNSITVQFFPDGWEQYPCPCLKVIDEPFSKTYCMCCGGHIKHHLQIALDKKLECTIVDSPLISMGKKPCKMNFKIIE